MTMPAKGKHRRPKSSSFSRGLAAAGTGGAVLAMPVIGATTAAAAPASAHSATVAQVAAAAKPATAVKASPTSYAVVAGDSLARIADALGVSGGWKQLYQDNQGVIGSNPAMIHPGLRLTVNGPAKAAAPAARDASADRADRSARPATLATATASSYANNLDGWIHQSLDIMGSKGIPGTYEGLPQHHARVHRQPDGHQRLGLNAITGVPSKGLLQVIQPTFNAYHVPGTSWTIYDPVANITAAANYAADNYGSMDNVNSAY